MGVVLKVSKTNKESELFIIASGLKVVHDVTLSGFFLLYLARIFWDFLQDKDQLSRIHTSVTSGLSQLNLFIVHRGSTKFAVFMSTAAYLYFAVKTTSILPNSLLSNEGFWYIIFIIHTNTNH